MHHPMAAGEVAENTAPRLATARLVALKGVSDG